MGTQELEGCQKDDQGQGRSGSSLEKDLRCPEERGHENGHAAEMGDQPEDDESGTDAPQSNDEDDESGVPMAVVRPAVIAAVLYITGIAFLIALLD